MIKINKRGFYFATITVFMVFFMVFFYTGMNENQKEEVGVTDFGKHAFGIVKGNLEGEKLRFFVGESVKISEKIALKNVKEKVGVYDLEGSNCGSKDGYIVITDECDYFGGDLSFVRFLNDSFDGFLRQYGDYNSENYEYGFENNLLNVKGDENIKLGVVRESIETEIDKKLDHDGILGSVKKYSKEYEVPENLVKALIMQESSGRVDVSSGSSYGVMQINKNAHPGWFDGSRNCNAETDVDCNINAGIELLRSFYEIYRSGDYENRIICSNEPERTKFLNYKNWEAALRLYNGGQCGCSTCDDDYVEKVMDKWSKVDLSLIGFLTVNIDVEEEVEYDFNQIADVVSRGRDIRDCVINGGDIDICASRESFEYIFNVVEKENFLLFDVEETDSDDVIKFGFSI